MTQPPADFAGLKVAALESRRAADVVRLIERFGGVPLVSPSMREVPLQSSPAIARFVNELITGQVDVVIFMTGVGVQHLLALVERQVDRRRFLDALSDVTTVARGPKPAQALRDEGLQPTWIVPEPNTWRELLAMLDQHVPLAHQHVALQEYGLPNPSLVAGLEARGAQVLNVQVYRWELPEDCQPLRDNIQRLANGTLDVVLFTSAQQVTHLLRVADELSLRGQVLAGLRDTVVASVGPTTSEMLRQCDVPVDFEPSHPKLGHLLAETAARSAHLVRRKRQVRAALQAVRQMHGQTPPPWYHNPFMKACRREPAEVTPVWLMRQAGRYMQEYRQIRAHTGFLELCKNPQLCSEVMVTAVQRLGVDAAIIFSDLLPILEPMGMELEYLAGDGPVIHNPVRAAADVDRVLELDHVDSLDFVMQTVRQTRQDLPADVPLIGFAGAPFTLASYVIEGGSSRNYIHTKTLMYRDPGAWQALMERMARAVTHYLNAQIAAGAQCVQLFDSWCGCLGPQDYRDYVLPYVRQIVAEIVPGVPVISFATGNPQQLPLLAAAGPAVVGVDWRIELDQAWQLIGHDRAIQGNLDPGVLLADRAEIQRRTRMVLEQAGGRPGHIFNLGHGILQQTPVDNAIALVQMVHEMSQR